ncbi:MAG: hypothetical protein ABIP29_04585, partial [Candidatus Eisenbacteria bacterium]
MAVGTGRDDEVERTFAIRAAPRDGARGVAGHDIGMRMAEAVVAADGDQCQARPHRIEEGRGARGARTVMRDLEHVAAWQSARDEVALDQRVDVPGEQDTHGIGQRHRDEQDDRLAVRRPPGVGSVVARRPDGAHLVAGAAGQ